MTAVVTRAVRTPGISRHLAMQLASAEYAKFTEQLRTLAPADWEKPTCCPAWDVRLMACHVLGVAELAASPVEQFRQMRAARRTAQKEGGLFIDALTALQTAKHAHRGPAELVESLATVGPRAARGRRRTPAVVRRKHLEDQPCEPSGTRVETWTVGYLTDTILTRDTWMHRSDIAVATGRAMTLTPDHDGVIVADVAAEWAQRHGEPCTLELTGPAGGSWQWGDGGPALRLDAVEFCRTLSGRARGDGLLSEPVPF